MSTQRPGTGRGINALMAPRGINLTRFVKWPKNVIIQRKKVLLMKALKVPEAITKMSPKIDVPTFKTIRELLKTYQCRRSKEERQEIIDELAKSISGNEKPKIPLLKKNLHCGIHEVTKLIERKRAKVVFIAYDCDPIDLVIWMPELCRANNVPFIMVKSRAALGKIVNLRTTACLAISEFQPNTASQMQGIITAAQELQN